MARKEDILIKPLLTEKVSLLSEKRNRYGFEVALHANKHQIKSAVEKLFDIKVLNVRTMVASGKIKRVKKNVFKLPKRKKAYIQVREGQKIEFFKGI